MRITKRWSPHTWQCKMGCLTRRTSLSGLQVTHTPIDLSWGIRDPLWGDTVKMESSFGLLGVWSNTNLCETKRRKHEHGFFFLLKRRCLNSAGWSWEDAENAGKLTWKLMNTFPCSSALEEVWPLQRLGWFQSLGCNLLQTKNQLTNQNINWTINKKI